MEKQGHEHVALYRMLTKLKNVKINAPTSLQTEEAMLKKEQ